MNSLIARVTRAGIRHPFRFLLSALALTAVMVWLASGLQIKSSFEALLPSDMPSVINVNVLKQRVGGDGTVLVSLEALDGAGEALDGGTLKPAMALAPVLAREFLALGPESVRAVTWNLKPTEHYLQDHWPMLLSVSQLQDANHALDVLIEQHKQHALSLGLDDSAEPSAADGGPAVDGGLLAELRDPHAELPRQRIADRFARNLDGFLVHPDHRSLVIVVRPTGTALGVGSAQVLLAKLHAVVDRHAAELAAHHLRVGFGGTFPLFLAEYEAILHDIASTAVLTISVVLLSLFLFFRDLRSTLALGTAVLMGVACTFGITRLVIGYLNTQTAFLGSIVVGNGINYGVIYLTRSRQLRSAGVALEPAALEGAATAARATLLASAATSVSFAMLILAANRGFRHFGFIGGLGMLLCWAFTFALLPPLLTVAEKIRPARAGRTIAALGARVAPRWLRRAFARPASILVLFAVLIAASLAGFVRAMPTVIEQNVQNITNSMSRKGMVELRRDNDRGKAAFGESSARALALLPNLQAAEAFCRVIDQRAKLPRFAPVIESCATSASVLPLHQAEKLALIRKLQHRLTDGVLTTLPPGRARKLREVRAELAAQTAITEAQVPSVLLDPFRERNGSLDHLAVVTVRSDANLSYGPRLKAFGDAVRQVPVDGVLYDATGENVIFADLVQNIEREGPLTTLGSFIGVCVLVAVFLRHWRISLEVLTALLAGVVLMGGLATALHLKINFLNFIVFPITFGIAVDYGANVITRIEERDGNVLAALTEVGPAVMLCSWTTMVGYGSLCIALNRALRSFGWYALVGEITSILTAVVLLPALALCVERWRGPRKVRT